MIQVSQCTCCVSWRLIFFFFCGWRDIVVWIVMMTLPYCSEKGTDILWLSKWSENKVSCLQVLPPYCVSCIDPVASGAQSCWCAVILDNVNLRAHFTSAIMDSYLFLSQRLPKFVFVCVCVFVRVSLFCIFIFFHFFSFFFVKFCEKSCKGEGCEKNNESKERNMCALDFSFQSCFIIRAPHLHPTSAWDHHQRITWGLAGRGGGMRV